VIAQCGIIKEINGYTKEKIIIGDLRIMPDIKLRKPGLYEKSLKKA